MTFEPLIHISPFMAFLQILMWGVIAGLFACMMSYLLFYLPWKNRKNFNKKDMKQFVWIVTGMWCVLGVLLIGSAINADRLHRNEEIVSKNVSQKYQVEEVIFAPRGRDVPNVAYPEQSESQSVTVKTNGKSRLATLTQDRETSEPTLTDVDNGQPMDDILRSLP